MAKYLSYGGLEKVWAKIKGNFLPLTGGTLSGSLSINTTSSGGGYLNLYNSQGYAGVTIRTLAGATSGGWARDNIILYDSTGSTKKFAISSYGSVNTLIYFYLGTGGYDSTDNVRLSPSGEITAKKFIVYSGTSSQFLKADGSIDSTEYASTSDAVLRKEHANYYPLVGSIYLNGGNPVAKITFPAPVVKTTNAWFMVTCEIVLGYSWQNYPSGRIFLRYYFYYNKAEDTFDAQNVKGVMIGTDLGTRVSLKYDISDPRVLYIITVNGYTTVAITNLCAGDTSSYHDYMATEFEKTTLDNVPEGLTTIPINTIDSSESGVKVNNSYIKTDADELGTAEINNICQ